MTKDSKGLPETLFGIPIVEKRESKPQTDIIETVSTNEYKVSLAKIPLVLRKGDDGIFRASIEPNYLAEHPEASEMLRLALEQIKKKDN